MKNFFFKKKSNNVYIFNDLFRKSSISYKVLNRLMAEAAFPDSIIKLIGNKLLSILDIVSENGILPSVEDTETEIIRFKLATLMLVPGKSYDYSFFPCTVIALFFNLFLFYNSAWIITKHPAEKLY